MVTWMTSPSTDLPGGSDLARILAETHAALAAARDEDEFLRAVLIALRPYGPQLASLMYVHCDAAGAAQDIEVVRIWSQDHVLEHSRVYHRRMPLTGFSLAPLWSHAPEELLFIADVTADPRCDAAIREMMGGARALAVLPLWSRRHGTWQGLLSMQWLAPRPLTTEEGFVYRLLMQTLAAFIASHRAVQALERALAERSTPLIPVSDDVLVLPIVGTIDTGRGRQLMDALLGLGGHRKIRAAIIDVTGVPTLDLDAARALSQAVQALRLRGVEAVLTGIRPEVAATIVALDLDFRGIAVRRTVQEALGQFRRAG
jgi:anti-anti-sigma regulatory factor